MLDRNGLMTVSPQDWGLTSTRDREEAPLLARLGLSKSDLENRAHRNTCEWLPRQFAEDAGAFHGYYALPSRYFSPPQTTNLIAPFQLLAAFDRYGDEWLLQKARRCSDWLQFNMVETHPMSLVLGGVRDNIRPGQLWTKYTADYVTQNVALYKRLPDDELLARAVRSSKFLLQSQNHRFCPKFDHEFENWVSRGWQSFGRVVAALIALYDVTGDRDWMERAVNWAEHGRGLQADNGCFYLIYDTYYSSDIAADEIRALLTIGWRTRRQEFIDAALAFADWHVDHQLPDGSWPLSVDRWGVTVGEYVGPGDVPNIAISLLMAHRATGNLKYLVSAVRALHYSLGQQFVPVEGAPFSDDPNACWGFWSWDPKYDFTMSADQSTHHVRGYWFFLDYFYTLDQQTQEALAKAVEQKLSAVEEQQGNG